ncbi:uncharacterized protein LOC123515856 [Portunus trituberculatus]|uniref:uncharacterized protein LOC123515856 n=1 Tax=Portunus trituberculatus TaxID=210409 RepID=UPI001E1CEFF9|nr:uncharacterized protein LOC123515856 [Portunus trituberculatus]
MDKLDPETLKHRRTTARRKATKLVNELTTIWNQKDQGDSDDLTYTIHQAETHLSSIQELQEKLDKQDILDDSNHVAELDKIVFNAKRLLTHLDSPPTNLTSVSSIAQSPYSIGKIKINFQLPTFKGDVLTWPEFWNLFTVAVHDSKAYSPVEKLVHLKEHLDGESARSIRGLPTTGDNYDVAIRILKERYGKEKFRQESVMAKLLSMPCIKEGEDLQENEDFCGRPDLQRQGFGVT